MSRERPETRGYFDPSDFELLDEAYKEVCAALGFVFHSYDEPAARLIREELARHIVTLAAKGEMSSRKLAALTLSQMRPLEAKWSA